MSESEKEEKKRSRRFLCNTSNGGNENELAFFEIKQIDSFKSIYEEIGKRIEFLFKGPNATFSLIRNCDVRNICTRKNGSIIINAHFLSDVDIDNHSICITLKKNSYLFQRGDGFLIEECK